MDRKGTDIWRKMAELRRIYVNQGYSWPAADRKARDIIQVRYGDEEKESDCSTGRSKN